MDRTLYVGQKCVILTGPTGARVTGYLPVSSANCEMTKPIETVVAFGHLGSLKVIQTNLTTCKSTFKSYLQSGAATVTNGGDFINNSGGVTSGIGAGLLNSLVSDAVNGRSSIIEVSPNGFKMTGMLSSFNIDMSIGGLGTTDFSFNGVGRPYFEQVTGNATTAQAEMPQSLNPVTTMHVDGGLQSGCLNSFKFSYDLPSDTLSCLGEDPDLVQGDPRITSVIATKPPYKTTISVEGFQINEGGIPPAGTEYILGNLKVSLPNGILTSQSFNNAAGNANASYNYTVEDISATFADNSAQL